MYGRLRFFIFYTRVYVKMSGLVDFVVVCGAPERQQDATPMPRLRVARYISDVAVYFPGKGETPPDGYERLHAGPEGREIDLNEGKFWKRATKLAVKYSWSADYNDGGADAMPPVGHPSRPLEDVAVYQGSADVPPPPGWETVKTTPTGRIANLNYGSHGNEIFLILRRAGTDANPGDTNVVTELTVVDDHFDELLPHGFAKIEVNLNAGSKGHQLHLCTKRIPWLSKNDTIAPCLLQRFPREDSQHSVLPPSIEHFCMPRAVQVKEFDSQADLPLPEWHPFVLTEGDGNRMFGAALVFWETVMDRDREVADDGAQEHQLIESIRVPEDSIDAQSTRSDSPSPPPLPPRTPSGPPPHSISISEVVARTKCISILSHHPFFIGFKKALKLLYQISISGKSSVPLERYIAHLTLCLPLPPPGSSLILDWGLGDSNAIIFSRPDREDLPLLGVSVLPLFHMLSPNNIGRLFALVLLERKVILFSRDLDVITPILEAVRVMTFPLNYSGIYIPMCATHVVEALLQAPMPFAIGLASEAMDRIEVPDGIWIVDLDTNRIGISSEGGILHVGDEDANGEWLNDSSDNQPLDLSSLSMPSAAAHRHGEGCSGLPREVFIRFVQRIQDAADEAGVTRDGVADVSNVFQSSEVGALAADVCMDVGRVRDAALRAMVELVGGYDQFLEVSSSLERDTAAGHSREDQSAGSLEAIFDISSFYSSKPLSWKPFLQALSRSMAFARMINERTVPSSSDLAFVFFDACHQRLTQNTILEKKSLGTWQENDVEAEWRRRKSEPLRDQVLLLSSKKKHIDGIAGTKDEPDLDETVHRAVSFTELMGEALKDPSRDEFEIVEEIMELFSRLKTKHEMNNGSGGDNQFKRVDVDPNASVTTLKYSAESLSDEARAGSDARANAFAYSTITTCISPDGKHQLIQGPDKFGLPISQSQWSVSPSFMFDDALLWPRTRLLHRLPVPMAETVAARSRLESKFDLQSGRDLFLRGSSGVGYYDGMVSARDEDIAASTKAKVMLRHLFGAWALTASANVQAICLDKYDMGKSSGVEETGQSCIRAQPSLVDRTEVGKRLAREIVKTMELFQGFVGAPLDQASYRAVLVACNASRLRFDQGARLVEAALQYYCNERKAEDSNTSAGTLESERQSSDSSTAGYLNIRRRINALTAGQVSIARELHKKEVMPEQETGTTAEEAQKTTTAANRSSASGKSTNEFRKRPATSVSSLEIQSILSSEEQTAISSDKLAEFALLNLRVWRRRSELYQPPIASQKHLHRGPLKSMVCMWADYGTDVHDSAAQRRSIPEAHVLLKVCSNFDNGRNERGGDSRRRKRQQKEYREKLKRGEHLHKAKDRGLGANKMSGSRSVMLRRQSSFNSSGFVAPSEEKARLCFICESTYEAALQARTQIREGMNNFIEPRSANEVPQEKTEMRNVDLKTANRDNYFKLGKDSRLSKPGLRNKLETSNSQRPTRSQDVRSRTGSIESVVRALNRRASFLAPSSSSAEEQHASTNSREDNLHMRVPSLIYEGEEVVISPEVRELATRCASIESTARQTHQDKAFEGQVSGVLGSNSNDTTDEDAVHSVAYISPLALRTGLEEVLVRYGRAAFTDTSVLRLQHPDLYFNMVWYCTRLHLPLPFFQQQVEWEINCATREDVPGRNARAEENVRCGPSRAWAKACLERRKDQRRQEGIKFEAEKADEFVKQLSVLEEEGEEDGEMGIAENEDSEIGDRTEKATPSKDYLKSRKESTVAKAAPLLPGSRLIICSDLLESEKAFLDRVGAGLKRGDVDDVLVHFIRSQHLHMPHIHAHPIFSVMRACAAMGAANEDLLGTEDVCWPHPASEYLRTNFDKLFIKASTGLPPQQRIDYHELNSALGLLYTDRSAAAMRWCFGDVFHATLEDDEEDLVEAEDERDEAFKGSRSVDPIGDLKDQADSASFKRRRSKAKLPLLERHLIAERAANFSPLK